VTQHKCTEASAPPPLAEQLVELSALTGGLAHEIRNPLSTLKVNLQLLDEDWKKVETPRTGDALDPQEVARRSRTRIGALLRETNRLEQILQDFLQYVGKRDLRPAPHDLGEMMAELADFYRPQAQAGGIHLTLDRNDVPLWCNINPTYLKQAILNLLINAQQAMPDGGKLHLSVGPEGHDQARIDVTDTGPGVPPDIRDQVFHAYFSTKKGGTGLGLATTQRIVREHRGTIRLAENPPGGACFTILLPRIAAPDRADPPKEQPRG